MKLLNSSNAPRNQIAKSFIEMVKAGADAEEVSELVRAHGFRTVHFQQMAVPFDLDKARKLIIEKLRLTK